MHESELKKHGKSYEFHMYPDAGHGFFYYQRPSYRPEQTMDGWKRIFDFFGKHLAAGFSSPCLLSGGLDAARGRFTGA